MSRLARVLRERVILMVMITRRQLVLLAVITTASEGGSQVGNAEPPDGARIAADPALFSEAVRAEFADMNERFGELGFELEVFQMPPTLSEITSKYGNPERTEELKIPLGFGADEPAVSVVFSYYGEFGFGVRAGDSEQTVIRIKRREE